MNTLLKLLRTTVTSKPARHGAMVTVLIAAAYACGVTTFCCPMLARFHAAWVGLGTWAVTSLIGNRFTAPMRMLYLVLWSCASILLFLTSAGVFALLQPAVPYWVGPGLSSSVVICCVVLTLTFLWWLSPHGVPVPPHVPVPFGVLDADGVAHHLALHERMRDDIRHYAGLLFTIVTTFITVALLVLGWLGSTYISRESDACDDISGYSRAKSELTSAPVRKEQTANTGDSAAASVLRDRRDAAEREFADRTRHSPSVAGGLSGFSMVFSIMICAISVIGYTIANRRRASHRLMRWLQNEGYVVGMPLDRITDRVFTNRAILSFGSFLCLLSAILTYYAGKFSLEYVVTHHWSFLGKLCVGLATLATLKFLLSSLLLFGFILWEYRQSREDMELFHGPEAPQSMGPLHVPEGQPSGGSGN